MVCCPPFPTVSLSDVECTVDFARERRHGGDEEKDGDVGEEVRFVESEGGR